VSGPAVQEVPESAGYLADRQLATGSVGWVVLAALGISYVVAGDYAAWNYGFAASGWGGMLIALGLMALMYLCLVFCLAELASAIPTAGGGYAFSRRAFGPSLGFIAGICVVIEYVGATGAIGIFLSSYFEALTGLSGPWVLVAFYILFLGIHLWGVGEALRLLLALALVAVVGIAIFVGTTLPGFAAERLVAGAAGAVPPGFLPFGAMGIWAALPFGIAFFLAVEGVPLASEEARDPARSVPRAMIVAWSVLALLAVGILIAAPGISGLGPLIGSDSPLIAAMLAPGSTASALAIRAVNIAGLIALAASFFSIMYAFSRQIFALSRAGYLPRVLSLTNRRKSPWLAILVPGLIAFLLSLFGSGEPLIVMAVFCATTSYLLMLCAFLRLRSSAPDLPRPYRTPGGMWTARLALVLVLAAFVACLLASPLWSLAALAVMAVLLAYFLLYSRHHLVANAPEEEFAAMAAASGDLR